MNLQETSSASTIDPELPPATTRGTNDAIDLENNKLEAIKACFSTRSLRQSQTMSSAEEFQPIYLSLPIEAQVLLADNGVELVAVLREQGFNVRRSATPDPTLEPSGEKDAALVILALGVSAILIGIAIAKVLDSLGRNRKYLVSRRVLVPAVDKTGKQVRDASGRPVMYWSDEKQLIEATQIEQEKAAVSLKVPERLEFELKSS